MNTTPPEPSTLDADAEPSSTIPEALGLQPEMQLWDESTRRRGFYGLLGAVTVAAVWLVWPFLYALVFAATTSTLLYPVYDDLRVRLGGRSHLASALTLTSLLLTVILPLSYLCIAAYRGARVLARRYVAADTADLTPWEYVLDQLDAPPPMVSAVPSTELASDQLLETFLSTAGPLLGQIAMAAADGTLLLVVYVVAAHYLLVDGRDALRATISLVPLAPRHIARLFLVYRRVAYNIVFGSLATAALQSFVAAVGLWLAGVPYAAALGLAIGLASFVPVVGTPAVWVPLSLAVAFSQGPRTALFVAAWNLLLTGTVDNLAKPLLIGGREPTHSLLVFLAIFGGMYWMGLAGLLIGPLIMALFIALYTIHRQEFLSLGDTPSSRPGERMLVSLLNVQRSTPPDASEGSVP